MPCGPIWRQRRRRQTADRRSTGAIAAPTVPAAVSGQSSAVDPVTDKVLEIVAAQTGYPLEMLELDLDMEADLGIDTVKQAETFQAIRNAFDIPRRDDLKLRDYPTLGAVIGFVYAMRPDLAQRPRDDQPRPPLNRSIAETRFRLRSAVNRQRSIP
jgi:acyl carrier protein